MSNKFIKKNGNDMFSPIVREKVTDQVVNKILDLIHGMTLTPGDKLPSQRELEQLLNVSRSTLREALSGLVMTGYLESRIGQGFYVCSRDKINTGSLPKFKTDNLQITLQNIYEARAVVETDLTGLAAMRATNGEIERLYKRIDEIQALPNSEAILGGLNFHQMIADAAGNPFLAEVEKSLLFQFSRYVSQIFTEPFSYVNDVKMHLEIVKAIEEHNYHAARKKAFEHIFAYVEDIDIHVFPFLENE